MNALRGCGKGFDARRGMRFEAWWAREVEWRACRVRTNDARIRGIQEEVCDPSLELAENDEVPVRVHSATKAIATKVP